jgi:predicted ATPase
MQWFDATSLEFLDLLIDHMPRRPILLLMTSRPKFMPSWSDHSAATILTLARLSPEDSAVLVHHVAENQSMSAQVMNGIVSRADGVPLFVEELTKAVLEAQRSKAADRHARSRMTLIPRTLHASLLERLDRQGEARDVAQVAAAIGREFSYELLHEVTSTADAELTATLDLLVTSGLILKRGASPLATYGFKHALVRDAAYDMLVRADRQQIHARIVAAIEARFPDTVATEPGLLAYHCQEAGYISKAIDYLLLASDRALSRAATAEVLMQLKQALVSLSALPEGNDRLGLELRLQVALGRAEIAAHGYAAEGTRDAFRRARELCEILNDQVWPPVAFLGEWVTAWWGGDQRTALDRAERLRNWGEAQDKDAVQAIAYMAAGMSLTVRGAFAEACDHLERALAINQFVVPGLQPFIASDMDGRIQCLSYLHDCLFLRGLPAQATNAVREASKEWPTPLYSLALAQTTFCRMYTVERNARETVRVSSKLLKLTEGQGYPFFGVLCSIYRGWALANTGDTANGVALCREGVAQLRATGTTCGLPGYLVLLAECYLNAGNPTEGLEAVAEAIAIAEHTSGRERLAEAHRLKGKLLLLAGSSALEAEACFREATLVARGQGARLFELRAAHDLAAMFVAQHRYSDARDILAPIFDSFTEAVDCTDLRESRDLLDRIENKQLVALASS